MEVLELETMRYADGYAVAVAQAADDFIAKASTSEARIAGVRWKLSQATAAYIDATGPNAVLNVLDLVVLATASRMVLEDQAVDVFGEAALPVLDGQRRLETNAWACVNRVLKPDQQKELMTMIQEWRQHHPDQRYVTAIRFRELAVAAGKSPQIAAPPPNSIFSLLALNPLAGMDPTTMAIQETRQLAERAMYYTQRMPTLLNWQMQLLSLQLTAQPEAKQILADANSLTKSTEAFAQVADQLPKLVNDQREAGIRQVLDGVAAERTNLLASLAAEEQKARALMVEARQTLDAGNGMVVSAQAAIKSLDEFVRYVSPPNTNQTATSTNGQPFNVLDYATTATQIGETAKQLDGLLATMNQSVPQLAQLGQQTTANANRVVDHAFRRVLILIPVFLVGWVVAGVTYRILANKWTEDGRKPFRPDSHTT